MNTFATNTACTNSVLGDTLPPLVMLGWDGQDYSDDEDPFGVDPDMTSDVWVN